MLHWNRFYTFFLMGVYALINITNLNAQSTLDVEDTSFPLDLTLTQDEKDWVKEHPVLRATNKRTIVPIEFLRGGEPAGFSVDYLNLVAENVGLKIEYVFNKPWSDLLEQLKNRQIDIAHNIVQTDERKKFLDFSPSYIELQPTIFGRKDIGKITSVDDLVGKKILVSKGWGGTPYYREKYPQLSFTEAFDHESALLSISRGESDFFIMPLSVGNYQIQMVFLKELGALGNLDFMNVPVMNSVKLASRNDWPQLNTILAKGMLSITNAQMQELSEKWMMPIPGVNSLGLSRREQLWLSNNPIVKVAVDPTIIPVEYIDDAGNVAGISGSYLKIIEEKLNVKIEWIANEDFKVGLTKIRNKEADIISAITPSVEREKFLDFTENYIRLDSVIFAREGENVFVDIDGLRGKTLVQIKNFQSTKKIRADYPEIKIIEVDTIQEALRLVSGGAADAYIGSVPLTSYNIAIENLTNLGAVGTTPYTSSLALGIRSDLPYLSSAVKKVIANVSPKKKAEINRQWMMLDQEPETDYTLLWQLGLVALFGMALILAWNYSLRQEVGRRKSTEERFRQIAESVDGLFFIATSDMEKINYVSPNFEEWTTYKCSDLYESPAVWRNIVYKEDLTLRAGAINQIRQGNFDEKMPDYRIVHKDGSIRWVSTQIHPVYEIDGRLKNVIGFTTDITQRINSAEKLDEIRSQFQNAFDYASHGMALITPDGGFHTVNDALCNILGYEENELIKLNVEQITHKGDQMFVTALMTELLEDKRTSYELEATHIRADGVLVPVQLNVSLVKDSHGSPVHFVAQIQDLSELKQREEQLRHSQKMDAVGQLTGGIAHDFNNILGIILGNLEILDSTIREEEKQKNRLKKAIKSVDRGSNLIKKLLSFSRNTSQATEVVNINDCIVSFEEFVAKTLTASVKIETHLMTGLWLTEIDFNEFEDAMLNLSLNAKDAMPDGGTVKIKTENITVDEDYVSRVSGSKPGDYVKVTVEDTGHGIDKDVLEKVLEPFFTTKSLNRGTGLGLSMVHGFVQRSGGYMRIQSNVGEGTKIALFIPRSFKDSVPGIEKVDNEAKLPTGTETVLVVDDEEYLCEIAQQQLKQLGYNVFTACDAKGALDILHNNRGIDLLFSDIVMPNHQDGYKVAAAARNINLSLKILLTSGYSQNIENEENEDVEMALLRKSILKKPYSHRELALAIRYTLDAGTHTVRNKRVAGIARDPF